jgi:hypothetical protein
MRAGTGPLDLRNRIIDDLLDRQRVIDDAFTKDVLAPFSSNRRTRYGNSSSCEPTGA